jgi:hypothetical protein
MLIVIFYLMLSLPGIGCWLKWRSLYHEEYPQDKRELLWLSLGFLFLGASFILVNCFSGGQHPIRNGIFLLVNLLCFWHVLNILGMKESGPIDQDGTPVTRGCIIRTLLEVVPMRVAKCIYAKDGKATFERIDRRLKIAYFIQTQADFNTSDFRVEID